MIISLSLNDTNGIGFSSKLLIDIIKKLKKY